MKTIYIALALDILTVVIVASCVYSAARKGFLRTVAQLAAYLVIVLVASSLSRAAAPVIYSRYVEPMLLGDQPMQNALLASAQAGKNPDLLAISPDLLELLPRGVDVNYWLERAQDSAEEMKDEILNELLDTTVRPAAINAIGALCFTGIFCLLSVIANAVLSAVGIVRYIPVIGRINAFLGAVIGLLEGVLLVWLAALFLRGMLTLGQGGWWIFTERAATSSWIFRYFFNPSLLASFFA